MPETRVALVLLLCHALPAQRYIVDASGGGNFLDLPQAVAAAPDGATLFVRPGAYTPFTLQGKGLTIVGDAAACTLYSFPGPTHLEIKNVPAGRRVLLSGFTAGPWVGQVKIANCAGSVTIRDLRPFPAGSSIQACADVHVHAIENNISISAGPVATFLTITDSNVELEACTLKMPQTYWTSSLGSFAGNPAVVLVRSQLTGVGLTLLGGSGYWGIPSGSLPGAHGLVVSQSSRVQIYGGSSITGGIGNPAFQSGTVGGNGIQCDGSSNAVVVGGTLAGGAGMPVGQPFAGPVTWTPTGIAPHATSSGAVVPLGVVTLKLNAVPSSTAALCLGDATLFQAHPLLQLGVLMVQPQLVSSPAVTDAQGNWSVPLTVPAAWPGATPLFAQFVTIAPLATAVSASGSLVLVGSY